MSSTPLANLNGLTKHSKKYYQSLLKYQSSERGRESKNKKNHESKNNDI